MSCATVADFSRPSIIRQVDALKALAEARDRCSEVADGNSPLAAMADLIVENDNLLSLFIYFDKDEDLYPWPALVRELEHCMIFSQVIVWTMLKAASSEEKVLRFVQMLASFLRRSGSAESFARHPIVERKRNLAEFFRSIANALDVNINAQVDVIIGHPQFQAHLRACREHSRSRAED